MKQVFIFKPEQLPGLIFHLGALLLLTAGAVWGIWLAATAEIGPAFLVALFSVLAGLFGIPLILYRGYALYTATYTLEREGIRLHWGLRSESIPVDMIRWVKLSSEVQERIPLPLPRWPGSVLGTRSLSEEGRIEFLAGRSRHLVLIAAGNSVFAISPQNPEEFLQTYQRLNELGSLAPLEAQSVYPSFLMARVWRDTPARILLIAGVVLNLILLTWVSLLIPAGGRIMMGFIAGAETVPVVQLLLLPIISSFFVLVDILLGLYLFRRSESALTEGIGVNLSAKVLAYTLWGGGVLTSLLLLIGTALILQNR